LGLVDVSVYNGPFSRHGGSLAGLSARFPEPPCHDSGQGLDDIGSRMNPLNNGEELFFEFSRSDTVGSIHMGQADDGYIFKFHKVHPFRK